MQQTGYHHANMLATKLREDLQMKDTEILALVRAMANADNNPPCNDVQSRRNLLQMLPYKTQYNSRCLDSWGKSHKTTMQVEAVDAVEEVKVVEVVEVVEKEAATEIAAHRIMQTLRVASSNFIIGRMKDATTYLMIALTNHKDIKTKLRWLIEWVDQMHFASRSRNDRRRRNYN